MTKLKENKKFSKIQEYITNFETRKYKEKNTIKNSGVVYTPPNIVDFIIKNLLKYYLQDLFNGNYGKENYTYEKQLNFNTLKRLIHKNIKIKSVLNNKIKNFRILDPACGTGRFLTSAAYVLYEIFKLLYPKEKEFVETEKNYHQTSIL